MAPREYLLSTGQAGSHANVEHGWILARAGAIRWQPPWEHRATGSKPSGAGEHGGRRVGVKSCNEMI